MPIQRLERAFRGSCDHNAVPSQGKRCAQEPLDRRVVVDDEYEPLTHSSTLTAQ
jgi:hypothetical protein